MDATQLGEIVKALVDKFGWLPIIGMTFAASWGVAFYYVCKLAIEAFQGWFGSREQERRDMFGSFVEANNALLAAQHTSVKVQEGLLAEMRDSNKKIDPIMPKLEQIHREMPK